MINKIFSSVASLSTAWFFVQAYFKPSDPVFLLKSSSMKINLVLLVLAVGSVCLAFLAYKLYWQTYLIVLISAVSLGFLSLLGLIDSHMSYNWPLGLWDYFLLLQFSVVFAISALETKHQPVPMQLPRISFDGLLTRVTNLLTALPQADLTTKPTRLQKS